MRKNKSTWQYVDGSTDCDKNDNTKDNKMTAKNDLSYFVIAFKNILDSQIIGYPAF